MKVLLAIRGIRDELGRLFLLEDETHPSGSSAVTVAR
jgi:hypothetical protein